MRDSATFVTSPYGATAEVTIIPRVPPTRNAPGPADFALEAAADIVGEACVISAFEPTMGGDDFGFFSERWPGVYIWLGAGTLDSRPLHAPDYDFNDNIIPTGIALWTQLVKRFCPPRSC